VSEIFGSFATVRTSGSLPSNESPLHLEIVVPVPRSPRLSWLVEKCTEVGVAAIRLIGSERAPRGLGERSLERLNRVALSAVEQSNRARVPEISGVYRWEDLGGILSSCHRSYFLRPGGPSSTLDDTIDSVVLLVGPEGGWSPKETTELVARCSGQLNLGPRTLRIETAAVTGAALFLGRD
jgi:16S rRNA (uracil1498-N3)-methyltransferase